MPVSEMVDLVLDGMVCEECGTVLEEGVGHPRRCRACENEQGQEDEVEGEGIEEANPFD
jgi:hypothetical protein